MTSPIVQRAQAWLKANPNLPEAIGALIIKVLGTSLSFGFSFLAARKLGSTGTGGFALTQLTALFGATFALFGLDYVLSRSMAGNVREGKIAEARSTSRTATLVTCGIAIGVGEACWPLVTGCSINCSMSVSTIAWSLSPALPYCP